MSKSHEQRFVIKNFFCLNQFSDKQGQCKLLKSAWVSGSTSDSENSQTTFYIIRM